MSVEKALATMTLDLLGCGEGGCALAWHKSKNSTRMALRFSDKYGRPDESLDHLDPGSIEKLTPT